MPGERRDKPACQEQMKELYVEDLASHDGPWHAAVIARNKGCQTKGVTTANNEAVDSFIPVNVPF